MAARRLRVWHMAASQLRSKSESCGEREGWDAGGAGVGGCMVVVAALSCFAGGMFSRVGMVWGLSL